MVALAAIGGKLYLTVNGGPNWNQVGDATKEYEEIVVDEATAAAVDDGGVSAVTFSSASDNWLTLF